MLNSKFYKEIVQRDARVSLAPSGGALGEPTTLAAKQQSVVGQ